MKENSNKKISKKPIIYIAALATILIAVALAIGVGYALFKDKDSGSLNLTVGEVEVTLTEDQDWEQNDDEYGLEKYTKVVKGVASNTSRPAYVRIKAIPIVQYYEEIETATSAEPSQGEGNETTGKWVTAAVPQDEFVVNISGTNWVKSGDYWYYTSPIEQGEQTTDLNVAWQIVEIVSDLAKKDHLRTDVRVVLEYAQAENDVWKTVFQINQLPF
jgi:hypothetical protein